MKNADDEVVLMVGKKNKWNDRRPWSEAKLRNKKIPTALCKFAIISLQAKQ